MDVSLSDEALVLVNDLVAVGVHGSSVDEVVMQLALDQLKHLMGTPGFSRIFTDAREKREFRAALDAEVELQRQAFAPLKPDADDLIPF